MYLLISSFSIWIFKGLILRLKTKRRLKRVIPAKAGIQTTPVIPSTYLDYRLRGNDKTEH